MAEGSAHLCRCTFTTTILLFLVSLILIIAAFNLNVLANLFSADTSQLRNTTKTHSWSSVQVPITADVTINVGLANFPNISSFPPTANMTNSTFVVLLHGFPESWMLAWNDTMPYLRTDWMYIVPDLRGAGNSTAPTASGRYNLTNMANDIAFVANFTTGGVPFHLVGLDYGAMVAYTVAGMWPRMVKTLTVFNAPHPAVLTNLLWNDTVQQNKSTSTLASWLNPFDTSYSDNGFSKLLTYMQDPASNLTYSWLTNNTAAYLGLWGGRWNQMVRWYRDNFILLNGYPNGMVNFTNGIVCNWPQVDNVTMFSIHASTRIYIPLNDTYFKSPDSINRSSRPPYVENNRNYPTTQPQGNHFIHHTNPAFVGQSILDAVNAPPM